MQLQNFWISRVESTNVRVGGVNSNTVKYPYWCKAYPINPSQILFQSPSGQFPVPGTAPMHVLCSSSSHLCVLPTHSFPQSSSSPHFTQLCLPHHWNDELFIFIPSGWGTHLVQSKLQMVLWVLGRGSSPWTGTDCFHNEGSVITREPHNWSDWEVSLTF